EVMSSWEQVFETGLDGLPVLRVLVTHMHPDHVGLAKWPCERFDVPLAMTIADYTMAALFSDGGAHGGATSGEPASQVFRQHGGTDPESLEQLRARKTYYSDLVPGLPSHFDRIADNDILQIGGNDWRVIIGEGHSPEHASLYCDALQV